MGRTCYSIRGTETYKKSPGYSSIRKKQRGWPKLRWEDGVMDDARKLGEKNWRNAVGDKDGWRKLLRKAWAQIGLLRQ